MTKLFNLYSITLLALVLTARSSAQPSAGATGPAAPVRSFSGEISAVDPARQTFSVIYQPTAFTVSNIQVESAAKITVAKQVEIDDLPEGQWLRCTVPKNTEASKTTKIVETKNIELLDAPVQDSSKWIETWWLSGQLSRIPQQPGAAPRKEMLNAAGVSRHLLTQDGKSRYALKIGAESWDFVHEFDCFPRPNVLRKLPGGFSAFKPGQPITLTIEERPDGVHLLKATVEDLFEPVFPYYVRRATTGEFPGEPAMETAEKFHRLALARYETLRPELLELMPVQLKVTPGLAMAGEPVTAGFEVTATHEPNKTLLLYPLYLRNGLEKPLKLELNWRVDGSREGRTLYRAELGLPAQELGQHLIRWDSNVGGDIESYWRSYAVIDASYAVVILNVLSSPRQPFYNNHLPINIWELNLRRNQTLEWLQKSKASAWANLSRDCRQHGANPLFFSMTSWNNYTQFREDSEALQRLKLQNLKSIIPWFGFDPVNLNYGDYGIGTATARIARELGFSYIHSLCNENHLDALCGINHWGKPERPYFISPDDFRKASAPEEDTLLGFSQLQRHLALARNYYCGYVPEAGSYKDFLPKNNDLAKSSIESFYRKQIDFVEAIFQNRLSQRTPYFLTFDFQFGGNNDWPAIAAGDQHILDAILNKAKTEPVTFATQADIAAFYRRHYCKQIPESTSYYQDYFAGIVKSPGIPKPAEFPDVMTLENNQLMSIHHCNEILPESHYDYTIKWDNSDYGNETIRKSRMSFGYFEPEKHDKFALTPRITDTRPMSVSRTDLIQPDGALAITLEVESERERVSFPLALWNIPRQWQLGEEWYRVLGGSARFVPVRAPYTGNLNGILVADLKPGKNLLTLRVNSSTRELQSLSARTPPNLGAQAIERDGKTTIYLWSKLPWGGKAGLSLPAAKSAAVYISPMQTRIDVSGRSEFELKPATWAQIEGLTKAEFEAAIQ